MSSSILSRFPIMSSESPDDLVLSLNSLYRPSVVRPMRSHNDAGGFELRGFAGDDYSIGFISSGIGVSVVGAVEHSYFINFGLSGELLSARGSERARNTASCAVVFNPGDHQHLVPSSPRTETLGLRIDRSFVQSELAALLGREAAAPVRFDFAIDMTARHTGGLSPLLLSMLGLFDTGHDLTVEPAFRRSQMRTFVTSLLLTQPHSQSVALRERVSPRRPRTLNRALEHIEQHLGEPLTLGDLAVAAGCSARTVDSVFRAEFGVSPMAHVRNRRLDRANELLRTTDLSVGDAALQSGFTHLGRFAHSFAERFGELPSKTRLFA